MERPPRSKPEAQSGATVRALKLLARREHTRRELEAKLAPHVEDPLELQALLDDFTARGWLSESRVVEQVVHAQRHRLGPARIRQRLLQRGASDEAIAPVVQQLKQSELETARLVWSKKFSGAGATRAEQARQVRFLQSRGFSLDVAMRVVNGNSDDGGEGA